MSENVANTPEKSDKEIIDELHQLLESGEIQPISEKLEDMHSTDIALALETLPRELREQLWDQVEPSVAGNVLLHVPDEVRKNLIQDTDNDELIQATQHLPADDLVDIFPDLPEAVTEEILQSIDQQYRHRLEAVMSFPEDTAGGLMNIDAVTVRPELTVEVVLRYLRFRGTIPETTDKLFVVDREDNYKGSLSINKLFLQNIEAEVADIMDKDSEAILVTAKARDVADQFAKRDWISAPVVNDNNKLLGRITIDDVVDVIRDEADHAMMSAAGLNEDNDMFAPVIDSSRRRAIWLGVNLLTALLASWVIGHFQDTIEKWVALAVLMPIVASMGGIAGSQTLTLVVRAIALGKISSANAKRLLMKELAVGGLNGVLWALVVALITVVWFGSFMLGVIIALAMVANLVMAALSGSLIPLALKNIGIDPALSAGVLLTTITDVTGFLVFLGLASWWLM